MSTTQHPLTDETRDRLVSYISGGTIDCSTHEGQYDSLSEDDARTIVESLWEPMTQAAQARPVEITEEMVEAGASYAWEEANPGVLGWNSLTEHHKEGCRRDARAVLSAALAVAPTPAEPLARTLLGVPEDHGAPHHDAKEIKPGDYVMQLDQDGLIRGGRAHHQDRGGDWHAKGGRIVAWAAFRADRPDALTVWPAPTPPAVEVEMPAMHPAHLPDVKGVDGDVCAHMALDRFGRWRGVDQVGVPRDWPPHFIAAFTLPDGTRARRDGEHENGEPRFVKTQEGEK